MSKQKTSLEGMTSENLEHEFFRRGGLDAFHQIATPF